MEVRAGDWLCPMCGDLNFASRQQCRRCTAVRPDLLALTAAAATTGSPYVAGGLATRAAPTATAATNMPSSYLQQHHFHGLPHSPQLLHPATATAAATSSMATRGGSVGGGSGESGGMHGTFMTHLATTTNVNNCHAPHGGGGPAAAAAAGGGGGLLQHHNGEQQLYAHASGAMPAPAGSATAHHEQVQAMQQIQAFRAMQEHLQAASLQQALLLQQQQATVAQLMSRAVCTSHGHTIAMPTPRHTTIAHLAIMIATTVVIVVVVIIAMQSSLSRLSHFPPTCRRTRSRATGSVRCAWSSTLRRDSSAESATGRVQHSRIPRSVPSQATGSVSRAMILTSPRARPVGAATARIPRVRILPFASCMHRPSPPM